ncbi:ATP-binding response regulator [Blastopirellula retiformator]|uniref:histidine kinase n=1 Tax=Blastopirellula retiformator TaxID=2527970 RepID=A0A5C5V9E6_9BACT|nr:response regulator [Blastopirellula retiformator]TWT34650.1 Sensor protein EvgS precursor [Blastopirellula retiformator]
MNQEVPSIDQRVVRLLLLEDDDADFAAVKRQLDRGSINFDVSRVDTVRQACSQLKKRQYDVVLVDLTLPDSSGVDTVECLAEHTQQTILLVVTGLEDDDLEQEILRRGVCGYFVKREVQGKSILRVIQHALQYERFVRQHLALVDHLRGQQKSMEVLARRLREENKLLKEAHELRIQEEATNFNHLVNHVSKEVVAMLAIESAQSSRAKSEFLLASCQELKTSLESVLAVHDHLVRSALTDQQRALVDASLASSTTLLRMVGEIIQIAQVETGSTQAKPFPCDLSGVIKEVGASAYSLLRSKDISLKWSWDDRFAQVVQCDGQIVRQILVQLLSNAIKFTTQGRIDIRGTTMARDCNGGRIRISVLDTGVGVPAELLEELQAAFAQGRLSGLPTHMKSSLGLSLAFQLVRLLGGEMGVESVRWKGSHFWCDIPVHDLPNDSHRRLNPPRRPQIKRPHFLKLVGNGEDTPVTSTKRHVLVAHPNRPLQLYLTEQLHQLGYTSDVAKDGNEVLAMLRRKEFDILMVDCKLPTYDVFSIAGRVTQLVSQTDNEQPPKIIAMSDRMTLEGADLADYENIDALASIPMEIGKLRATLEECLAREFS